MALGDFLADVAEIVNESDDVNSLIAASARRAHDWIERRHSFQHMRETEYFQFGTVASGITVLEEMFPIGPTDVQLSNPLVDGQITVSSVSTPYYSLLAVGDSVQFGDGVASAGFSAISGTYGTVVAVNLVAFGGNVVIAVPDDGLFALATQLQPTSFSIRKLSGSPYATDNPIDPGLLAIGKRVKRIKGPLWICDDVIPQQVLRKVERIYDSDLFPAEETFVGVTGSVPGGYRQLGRGDHVAALSLGFGTFDPDDWILQFRPIPDKNYHVRVEAYRFSLWPTDTTASHWLIEQYEGLLLARTMYELAPSLKDKGLAQDYAERLGDELTAAKMVDAELEESDADDDMAYDPDFHADR